MDDKRLTNMTQNKAQSCCVQTFSRKHGEAELANELLQSQYPICPG